MVKTEKIILSLTQIKNDLTLQKSNIKYGYEHILTIKN